MNSRPALYTWLFWFFVLAYLVGMASMRLHLEGHLPMWGHAAIGAAVGFFASIISPQYTKGNDAE